MLNFENKINKEKIANETFVLSRYLDDYFGLIILVVCILIIILSISFVGFPRHMQAVETIQTVTNTLNDEKSSLEKYKGQLINYKETYFSISDLDKEKINDIIGPPNKFTAVYRTDLLISYRDLLAKNGFSLERIDVSEIENAEVVSKKVKTTGTEEVLPVGVGKMLVAINVKGLSYEKLKSLLSLLEAELRIADIRDLSCTAGIESCDIKLETYYFISPEL